MTDAAAVRARVIKSAVFSSRSLVAKLKPDKVQKLAFVSPELLVSSGTSRSTSSREPAALAARNYVVLFLD